ncbi:hypothetical protein ExPUPEC61_02337 [Escherichia coli]|nr:hypothetical protein ExPUPEC61_02337 [Escherichia coli]
MISKILFQCDFNSFRSVQRRAAAEGDNNVGLKGFKTRRAGSQNINIWIRSNLTENAYRCLRHMAY